MRYRLPFIILMLLVSISSQAQKVKIKAYINEIVPMNAPSRTIPDYVIELRNDSAFFHLPAEKDYDPVSGFDGPDFDKPYYDLSIKDTKKKNGKIVSFKAKPIVEHQFKMTLWDNKKIDIDMQLSYGSHCHYSGYWDTFLIDK